jgi:hypothetical protein
VLLLPLLCFQRHLPGGGRRANLGLAYAAVPSRTPGLSRYCLVLPALATPAQCSCTVGSPQLARTDFWRDGRRGREGRSPSSRALRRLSLIRRRPSCFVTHARSPAPIAFAFKADSLAPMISLKRWISRSRSCVSDIPVIPRNARDPTLEPHANMRSLHRSAKQSNLGLANCRIGTKFMQSIAQVV